MLFHRDGTVELGVAEDVPSLTTEEDNDDMSVEEEQATAAASDPSPSSAHEEKISAPLRRSKRRRASVSVSSPSGMTTRSGSVPSRAALVFKKKTRLTGETVAVTGKSDKFRDRSIVQEIAKKMGATFAGPSGKVDILFVFPKNVGEGTRKLCINATEKDENYFVESARKAVTNFPPGSTADEQLDLLIQDVSQSQTSVVRRTNKYLRSGEVWHQCLNKGVNPSMKGNDMNQPGSSWANLAQRCCAGNFILSAEQIDQGDELNPEGTFPPMEFERLPSVDAHSTAYRRICIVKGCYQVLNNQRGGTCLKGCCLKHTKQYGKKGPPKTMKRTKTYKRRDLQIEVSTVSTVHKITQWTTRRRLSDR